MDKVTKQCPQTTTFLKRKECRSGSLGARLLPQSYRYPNLSEGADRVGGQLRGDKECPFSGVTKSGSLEEAAGKRCSECAVMLDGVLSTRVTPHSL